MTTRPSVHPVANPNTSPSQPCIDVALGLGSWLVMRHGHGVPSPDAPVVDSFGDEGRMACYFCADVVAPQNSMRDRTIDQQCTVTRPGLAPIASGMAVEVMVAMLHRRKGAGGGGGAGEERR